MVETYELLEGDKLKFLTLDFYKKSVEISIQKRVSKEVRNGEDILNFDVWFWNLWKPLDAESYMGGNDDIFILISSYEPA